MARIVTYGLDSSLDPEDKILGSDGKEGDTYGDTKNFGLDTLKTYFQQGATFLGWARYDDTVYTESNKLSLTDGVQVTIPNNAGNIVAPDGVPSFYDPITQKVQATGVNNTYILTVVFKARAANTNTTHLDFSMYAPVGQFDRISKVLSFNKGNNTTQNFHEMYQYYSDASFVENGVELKISADGGSAEIWDIIYFIQKVQQP